MGGSGVTQNAFRAILAGLEPGPAAGIDAGEPDAILKHLAPYLLILEMNRGLPVYVLAGSAIRCALGGDPRGRPYYEQWDAAAQAALRFFFGAALRTHQPLHILSDGRTAGGVMPFETVLIPLAGEGAKACFVGLHVLMEGDADDARPVFAHQLHRIAFLDEQAQRRYGARPVPVRDGLG